MPTGANVSTWMLIGAGTLALLAGSVYPFVSVMRTAGALPLVRRWLWALATVIPGLVCIAFMPSRQFVALALNWLAWLIFLWHSGALTWHVERPWRTGVLGAIALLAVAYVGFALWMQHDSKDHGSLASERTASS